jgi:hypothetical protein
VFDPYFAGISSSIRREWIKIARQVHGTAGIFRDV